MVNTKAKQGARWLGVLLANESRILGVKAKAIMQEQHIFKSDCLRWFGV